ncbi:hypothetical protein PFLUV_G00083240 [Perca fluviatilis]|uniref:G-protein coupled receptors family 1 profile domain-containing protein n=1 Tax=Perca fluviatilis TaxID=8168 RepID=A0A6A5FDK7_PERFL|nr:hypothetical protein PFLUV_G00083240 [Perca fluviatilis]
METDNVTSTEDTPAGGDGVLRKVRMASLVIYCVIVIVGTLGNGLVIYVTGCRMKRTVNSVWFLNLALADFLFTAFLIFTIISSSQDHQWQFGEFMCKFNSFVIIVNMFASVFLLTAISLDRCLSIWVVVWAQNKRTVRKAQLICVCIWMTAMVCSTPYAIFRRLVGEDKTYCTYSITHEQKWILGIFRFVVGFLIPFLKKLRQSICFVLESALAEDHLSFMSSRSLSSHLSRFSRKSDSAAPLERKDTATSLNFTESKVVMTDERDCEH